MIEKFPETIGEALRDRRAGLEKILYNQVKIRTGNEPIQIESDAFCDYQSLPRRYTADGSGLSPPLSWTSVPGDASSLVVIVEDPDGPTPQPLVHAIVIGVSAGDGSLQEGALRSADHEGAGLKMGRNAYLQTRWIPPDPPPGHGAHRYAFQIFALAKSARFTDAPNRDEVEDQLRRFAIASGCLIGIYERAGRGGS